MLETADERRAVAQSTLESLRSILPGSAGPMEVKIASLSWMGLVHPKDESLIVWVLVDGQRSNRIPAWYVFDAAGQVTHRPIRRWRRADPEVLFWLVHVRAKILAEFRRTNLPVPQIGFESKPRVDRVGSFAYFR